MFIYKFNKLIRKSISFKRKKVFSKEIIIHPMYFINKESNKISYKDIHLDNDISFIKLDTRGK